MKNQLIKIVALLCVLATATVSLDAKVRQILAKNADGTTVDVTEQFETDGGEISSGDQQLVITTEDGSVITVNPQSNVIVSFGDTGATEVTITAGAVIASSQGAPVNINTVAGTFTTTQGNVAVQQSSAGDNNVSVTAVNAEGSEVQFTPSDSSVETSPVLAVGEQTTITGKSDGQSFSASNAVTVKADPVTVSTVNQVSSSSIAAVQSPVQETFVVTEQDDDQGEDEQAEETTAEDSSEAVAVENDGTPEPVVIEIPVDNVEVASNPG